MNQRKIKRMKKRIDEISASGNHMEPKQIELLLGMSCEVDALAHIINTDTEKAKRIDWAELILSLREIYPASVVLSTIRKVQAEFSDGR